MGEFDESLWIVNDIQVFLTNVFRHVIHKFVVHVDACFGVRIGIGNRRGRQVLPKLIVNFDYFGAGRPLAGVVVLMDARHPMTSHDERLLGWLNTFELRLLAVLTKSDKLSRSEGTVTLNRTRQNLAARCEEAILFSSSSGAGVEQVRELLWRWVAAGNAATGDKRPPV